MDVCLYMCVYVCVYVHNRGRGISRCVGSRRTSYVYEEVTKRGGRCACACVHRAGGGRKALALNLSPPGGRDDDGGGARVLCMLISEANAAAAPDVALSLTCAAGSSSSSFRQCHLVARVQVSSRRRR